LKTAENDKLPANDVTLLTFYLNYTVFLHDCLGKVDEAMTKAKEAIFSAIKEMDGESGSQQKDIILLCQMIKDNLALWKNGILDLNKNN